MPDIYLEKVFKSLDIWIHNSLVGHKMRVWGFLTSIFVSWIDGNPNAPVLPVPVCAVAIISSEINRIDNKYDKKDFFNSNSVTAEKEEIIGF